MNQITYMPFTHKGECRILVKFAYNTAYNLRMKQVQDAAWSKSLRCWHIPDTEENRKKCGLALLKENKLLGDKTKDPEKSVQNIAIKQNNTGISVHNAQQLSLYIQQLQLKAYSPNTIRTYRNEFMIFLQTLKNTNAESLTMQRLKDYLQYCHATLKLSEHTIHSRMNARHPVGFKK